jgi:hypothetical protein
LCHGSTGFSCLHKNPWTINPGTDHKQWRSRTRHRLPARPG